MNDKQRIIKLEERLDAVTKKNKKLQEDIEAMETSQAEFVEHVGEHIDKLTDEVRKLLPEEHKNQYIN